MAKRKLSKNERYKSLKIRIKDKRLIKYLWEKIFETKHFENILLILIHQDLKQNNGQHFELLTNGEIIRAVIRDTDGGKKSEQVKLIKEYYKDNKLMKALIEASKSLKSHNLVEQVKDIKKNFACYNTKIEKGDLKAKPPKAKKLKNINRACIFIDGYKGINLKYKMKTMKIKNKEDKNTVKNTENILGINLNDKMIYTYMPHDILKELVGDLDNICNINIQLENRYFYYNVNYIEKKEYQKQLPVSKYAGIDPGVRNLLSVYIDDKDTDSLIISGERYLSYNSKNNRMISKISSQLSFVESLLLNVKKESVPIFDFQLGVKDTFKNCPDINSIISNLEDEFWQWEDQLKRIGKDIKELKKFRTYLYEKRNNFFFSEFHKVSTRVLEYLSLNKVTHVGIPFNLSKLKNKEGLKGEDSSIQNFIQLPIVGLLRTIQSKAAAYGITVIEVDEAFTSKVSSLSKDIYECKEYIYSNIDDYNLKKIDEEYLSNVFNGIRDKRGLFIDTKLKKIVNADLNAARNICKLAKGANLEELVLKKLCNPIVIKEELKLLRILKAQ